MPFKLFEIDLRKSVATNSNGLLANEKLHKALLFIGGLGSNAFGGFSHRFYPTQRKSANDIEDVPEIV